MASPAKLRSLARKLGVVALVLTGAGAAMMGAWYHIDGQPLPEAAKELEGEHQSTRELDDGSLVVTPKAPSGRGLLIFHGALIEPRSYARTAAFFAQRGMTVFLPRGPQRLSIRGVEGAAARMSDFPQVKEWFLLGHSMGGMASLTLAEARPNGIKGIALWAAAMPRDFTKARVPVLFLWGDSDGLLPAERLVEVKSKLPSSTRYATIEGGNHRGFAMYSHQFFDRETTLDGRRQIDLANEQTAAFFDGL